MAKLFTFRWQSTDYEYTRARKISNRDIQSIVFSLGGVEEPEDLSVDQLYKILEIQPISNGDGVKIQKTYSLIKKALYTKKEKGDKLSIPSGLKLYARKFGEPKGEYLSYRNVYYWDNDRLPKNILKDKPKLEIGHRVGEKQVRAVFGINLPEDDNIRIVEENSIRNIYFEDNLNRYLRRRYDYILAFRVVDIKEASGYREAKKSLDEMNIRCYSMCKVLTGSSETLMELGSNEMVVTKGKPSSIFNICYSKTDVEIAFRTPEFNDAITEAIAIAMKLKNENSEFIDAVSTILSGDERMNDFFVKRKLGDDAQTILQRFQERPKRLAIKAQSDRLNELLKIRSTYHKKYGIYLYNQLKDTIEKQRTFKDKFLAFWDSNDWLENLSKDMLPDDDIISSFNNRVLKLFGVTLDELECYEDIDLSQLKEYSLYLEGLIHLSNEDMSLTFFPGNESIVEKFREKYSSNEPLRDEVASDDNKIEHPTGGNTSRELFSASWADDPNERHYSTSSSELGTKQPRKRHMTASKAFELGEDATQAVIDSMKQHSDLYGYIRRVDENGDKASGTDAHHYDIEYYDKRERQIRYLEVKSLQGNECTMTPMEYKTGVDNPDKYDIAFVREGKPYLFRRPFLDARFKECIWATQYAINIVNLKFLENLE